MSENDNSEEENREQDKKDVPVIPPRVVNIKKGYYDLSREEQRAFLRNLLGSLSPNEEVRKKAREEAEQRKEQG